MCKGLYIHIPFCSQICSYCDFVKQVAKPKTIECYIETLIKELNHYKTLYKDLETIYIGGGTPSSIPHYLLQKLLDEIHRNINIASIKEFTIETNPNDISEEFVELIQKYSINRVSIGVQTVNDNLLRILNRNHTKKDVVKAISLLRSHNINNINLDFIYGIPFQTIKQINNDLDFIKQIKPEHISYYSLILEEKTVLNYQIEKGSITPLDDDLVADFSDLVKASLKNFGYDRYETSNYSFEGNESIHNLIYWNLEAYLGIGLGAASQYSDMRLLNQTSMSHYLKDYKTRVKEDFSPEMEFILMGLRKIKGISVSQFYKRFNEDLFTCFPKLEKHLKSNLLQLKNDFLSLTELGHDLANQVFIDII